MLRERAAQVLPTLESSGHVTPEPFASLGCDTQELLSVSCSTRVEVVDVVHYLTPGQTHSKVKGF